MVCVAVNGKPVIGVIHQPFIGFTGKREFVCEGKSFLCAFSWPHFLKLNNHPSIHPFSCYGGGLQPIPDAFRQEAVQP